MTDLAKLFCDECFEKDLVTDCRECRVKQFSNWLSERLKT